MPKSAKLFAERLNNCLDEVGAPSNVRERALVLSKMAAISKHQAWSLLEGHQIPEQEILNTLANELEVESNWLSGEKS